MEDWSNHDSPQSPDAFYCHGDRWSPGQQDESDWMESDNGAGRKEEGAWPDEGRVEEEEELGEEGAELGAVNEDDVYVQLAQKEQDLMLAAELGNALLEKNQELEQQVAKLTDQFSRKVEIFEQERHSLQSQLTQRQAEFENTVRDLQDDISNLKEQLRHHDDETSAGQRRHVQDVRQLQQQNEALSEQLRQSLAQQEALSAEAGQLREQLTSRRSNFHQRVDHVGELEDEVECLRQRQQDLEVQIRRVKEERDALTTELESLHERLLVLEKQRLHQDEQLLLQHTELQELRDTNSTLQSQLEQMTSRHHTSGDSPTLFSELSHLNNPSISPPMSFIQFNNGESVRCLSSEMLDMDNDFEYDDDIFYDVVTHSTPVPADLGCHGSASRSSSLYDELFCQHERVGVEGRMDEGQGGAAGGSDDQQMTPPRRPVTLTDELHELLKEMQYSDSDDAEDGGGTGGSGHDSPVHAEADHDVTEMTYETSQHDEKEEEEEEGQVENLSSLNRLSQQYFEDMVQAQQCRAEKLECRVQELECRVQELQEERDRLQDAACGDVTASQVLEQTRRERDNALRRVSEAEKELSRLTADVVTLNGQLMDTIRKKVMISQELDQWQVDLSEVLAVQMHRRMKEQHKVEEVIDQLQKGTKPDITVFKKQKR